MSEEIRFRLLGPVSASLDRHELPLGTPQQRTLLAALLLREGAHVTVEALVHAVWGPDAPSGAVGVARSYVSRLRRILRNSSGQPAITAVANGYVLPTTTETLDFARFRQLSARAESARREGDQNRASQLLREATDLFSGWPLAGLTGGWADSERGRMLQIRLAAVEQRLAVDLDLGRQAEVAAESSALVAEHPLREDLRKLQMLAFYRAGRRAEALAVFQDTRRVLDRELGIEPGPALQEIHRQVLRADPVLSPAPAAREAASTPPAAVVASMLTPAQLPADLVDFTGHEEEIRALSDLLARPGTPRSAGITGLAAVGKSALAVHVAHRVRRHFPDGQVYAELGGSERPADASAVLKGFLRTYGIADDAIPATLPERAALWRTILSGRRILVVLDDVYDSEQVRHLLPPSASSAAIVTSWRRLVDLPTVAWIKVDVLRPDDSTVLLERIAGDERVRAEREAAQRLTAVCSHHPLALRLAGARLLARPSWAVATIERRLVEEFGDLTVQTPDCLIFHAPIERTLRRIGPELASAFRLLAVPDAENYDVAAASVVLDLPRDQCYQVLESLVDAHLLEQDARDRYRFHGMTRVVARRLAYAEDEPARGSAAIARLARFTVERENALGVAAHAADRGRTAGRALRP